MADKKDFYDVLGVQKGADGEAIKKAYRKKAMEFHPDRNPGDKEAEERFKEVNEAYEVLSDDQKRAAYDQYGHAGVDPNRAGGAGWGQQTYSAAGFDVEDLFSSIFGGGRRGQSRSNVGPRRGSDLETTLTIAFEEAAFGTEKEFSINHMETCSTCHGNGAKPGTQPETCPQCHGSGSIPSQMDFFGLGMGQTCPSCHGEGKIVRERCNDCRGKSVKRTSRSIKVKVPSGVNTGNTITLRGQGDAGQKGGQPGDLRIRINVKPHNLFVREGYDLKMDMTISYTQAVLGGEIAVPTLEGTYLQKIPEGTQAGDVIRIPGKGIAKLNGKGNGDLRVRVVLDVPRKLSGKQKEMLKDFEDSFGRKAFQTQFNRPKDWGDA